MWPSSLVDVCYLTYLDMTDYTLDYMTGVWPQQEKFTLPGHLFSQKTQVAVLSWVWQTVDWLMIFDDGRLFSSLYIF